MIVEYLHYSGLSDSENRCGISGNIKTLKSEVKQGYLCGGDVLRLFHGRMSDDCLCNPDVTDENIDPLRKMIFYEGGPVWGWNFDENLYHQRWLQDGIFRDPRTRTKSPWFSWIRVFFFEIPEKFIDPEKSSARKRHLCICHAIFQHPDP